MAWLSSEVASIKEACSLYPDLRVEILEVVLGGAVLASLGVGSLFLSFTM
jgi:hypothetical protein